MIAEIAGVVGGLALTGLSFVGGSAAAMRTVRRKLLDAEQRAERAREVAREEAFERIEDAVLMAEARERAADKLVAEMKTKMNAAMEEARQVSIEAARSVQSGIAAAQQEALLARQQSAQYRVYAEQWRKIAESHTIEWKGWPTEAAWVSGVAWKVRIVNDAFDKLIGLQRDLEARFGVDAVLLVTPTLNRSGADGAWEAVDLPRGHFVGTPEAVIEALTGAMQSPTARLWDGSTWVHHKRLDLRVTVAVRREPERPEVVFVQVAAPAVPVEVVS